MSTPADSRYGFILLAAGKSTRFGGKKLLATLPDSSKSILETTLEQLPTQYPIHVVRRPSQTDITQLIERAQRQTNQTISFSGSENSTKGMGHSIAEAIHATQHWNGWVICLGDMPWIKTSTYLAIIDALKSRAIVAPHTHIDGHLKRGNPVGFSKRYQQQLITLSEDTGARAIVQANSTDVYKLSVKDPGILLDIDYPSDINKHLD